MKQTPQEWADELDLFAKRAYERWMREHGEKEDCFENFTD